MNQLIKFALEDGSSVIIETNDPITGGVVRASRSEELIAKAEQTFEATIDQIKSPAIALIARLRNLTDSPDEIEMEFGIKLSADIGAFIASASTEANFRISLTWRKK